MCFMTIRTIVMCTRREIICLWSLLTLQANIYTFLHKNYTAVKTDFWVLTLIIIFVIMSVINIIIIVKVQWVYRKYVNTPRPHYLQWIGPTKGPTTIPTNKPTNNPTEDPTMNPTSRPTCTNFASGQYFYVIVDNYVSKFVNWWN